MDPDDHGVETPTMGEERKLRIAIISPYAHHPGHHWGTARDLAGALRGKGHDVEIIVTTDPIEPVDPSLSSCLVRALPGPVPRIFQSGSSPGHNLETMVCTLQAWRRHGRRPYDVWHYVDATHILLFLVPLITRALVVYHLWGEVTGYEAVGAKHSQRLSWRHRFRSWLARRALSTGRLAMVCETEETQRSALRFFPGHVHQIPYAVRADVARLDQGEARAQLGIAPEEFVLLMFGTHRLEKDYDTVVQGSKRQNICLLFAGKTISANDPAKAVSRHGHPRAVIVEKFISAAEAPLYFAACDAAVLPYTGDYTKGSYVLFEAFQFRRPTVVADTGFLRAFVLENRCGFVYRPGDADDFARVVTHVMNLPEKEKAELADQIARTAGRYSWETVISRYVALYRQYLKPLLTS